MSRFSGTAAVRENPGAFQPHPSSDQTDRSDRSDRSDRLRFGHTWPLSAVAVMALAFSACRGSVSTLPPVHIWHGMEWQPKYHDQGESRFFADGRAMRPLVPGTVAHGFLDEDTVFYRGMENGQYVAELPLAKVESALRVDSLAAVMQRGRQRFNIYCAPCHDTTGNAQGLVVQHGYPTPLNLSSQDPLGAPDGKLFGYITDGIRNMPPYGPEIPVADRWAIVAWVRVIQRSQHATVADVPAAERGHILPEESP